ncbi:MAG TPA: hypothetical protein VF556_18640 [Pyrinomonadaceae bacterium]|jgi:hypothetical protein
MKKSLFGLTVALTTFFVGIFTFEVCHFQQNPVLQNALEKNKIEEIKVAEIPAIKAESLGNKETLEKDNLGEQYFSGWYQLDSYKNMPEVQTILLARHYEMNDDFSEVKRVVSSAGIFTSFEKYGDQGVIESNWAEVDEKKAKFRTKKIKGIEYRFEGAFFKNKTSGEDGEKVLRGILRKYVKGKKIAEVRGDFAYYEPHC